MDSIDNSLDIIDSRDIIERLAALQEYHDELLVDDPSGIRVALWIQSDDGTEYLALQSIQNQCRDYVNDWEDGTLLVRRSHFTNYIKDLLIDCGYLSSDLPWFISDNINWDGVATDCMCDYTDVDFDGVTYYVR